MDLNWKSAYEIGISEMDVQHNLFLSTIRSIDHHDLLSLMKRKGRHREKSQ